MPCNNTSNSTRKVKTSRDYVVPGFNEYAKELYTEKAKAGLCSTDVCQSRLRIKSVLKLCQRNKHSLRANALTKFCMQYTHTHSGKTLSM